MHQLVKGEAGDESGSHENKQNENRVIDGLFIRPADDLAAPVELEDLSRFEGEGGPEAPIPDLVDVPVRERHLAETRARRDNKRMKRK